MRSILAAFLIGVPLAASAKDLTITLTDQEWQAVVNVLDLGVKSGGLSAAPAAIILLQKVQAADHESEASPDIKPTPAPENPK